MKPILYSQDETNFTSNGIGVLADAISCEITTELQGIFELEMEYPVSGIHYSELKHSAYLKAVPGDVMTAQLFMIYEIEKPINGIVTVHAEHISYRLSYIPTRPFTAGSVTEALQKLKSQAMEPCPFEFWTDKSTVATYTQQIPESINAQLKGERGGILDVYGGDYEFDNFTVKLHNHRGEDNGVILRYGKNITDIKQEESIANTYTGIVGFWKGQNDAGNDVVVQTELVQSEYADAYPFHRTKVVDFSSEYENQPTFSTLTARAEAYLRANNVGIPHVNIDVSFVALWQTAEYKDVAPLERVRLGDTVTVAFEKLGINAKARVVKTVYDVLLNRYKAIEIGEARSTLAGTIISIEDEILEQSDETISELEKAVTRTSKLITGNLGGYLVFRYNSDGKPYEMLIMDNPDINLAQKVWRWNQQGLGYSSTGYNGTYRLGMTINGEIVADFITTGTLTANLIKAGVLTDIAGKFYLNMQTGELVMSDGTFSGTITASTVNSTVLDMGGEGNGKINMYDSRGRLRGEWTRSGFVLYNSSGNAVFTASGGDIEMTGSLSTGSIDIVNEFIQYEDDAYIDMSGGGGGGGIHINADQVVFSVDGLGITDSRSGQSIRTGYDGQVLCADGNYRDVVHGLIVA